MVYTNDEKRGFCCDKIESGVDNRCEDENNWWNEYARKCMQQETGKKIISNEDRW